MFEEFKVQYRPKPQKFSGDSEAKLKMHGKTGSLIGAAFSVGTMVMGTGPVADTPHQSFFLPILRSRLDIVPLSLGNSRRWDPSI